MVSYMNLFLYGVGGIVVAGISLLVALQEKLVYVPVLPGLSKSYPITPARLRLQYEDVWLRSSDGVRLHAWFIKLFPDCTGPTILFFQENAGNIAHRLEMVRIMLQRLRCNVFMLSYRGCAALDHLTQRTDIDASRIVVFGRSLGGAVGAALTKNNPDKVAAFILENTFTSILDMAGVLLPFLKWFIGGSGSKGPKVLNCLVRSPWSTIDIIGQIKQPILFLSGLQDEMVPPSHMQMLYAKAATRNRQCVFVEFPTGMHMDTWLAGGDHYWQSIQLFLEQNAPENKERTHHNENATTPEPPILVPVSIDDASPLPIADPPLKVYQRCKKAMPPQSSTLAIAQPTIQPNHGTEVPIDLPIALRKGIHSCT
ncbi:alpha/beta hydrolase domain-containing protein WAV2-like [Macadamia integrifolia]|uniref:alpha/beta hydrolase domain-containing protein WAV2-like n=1 Tax=Macadamia integrifolia TaxID=60698 RepID=UPI001C4FBAF5|nr:alpha/beta hydrolase domain-containing protein WAV2-like [Macadamia integrifolia]